jgi:hypothetical protein
MEPGRTYRTGGIGSGWIISSAPSAILIWRQCAASICAIDPRERISIAILADAAIGLRIVMVVPPQVPILCSAANVPYMFYSVKLDFMNGLS